MLISVGCPRFVCLTPNGHGERAMKLNVDIATLAKLGCIIEVVVVVVARRRSDLHQKTFVSGFQ